MTTFELVAIAICSSAYSFFSQHGFIHASVLSITSSAIAMTWNWGFSTAFEAWERRQSVKGRSFKRRFVQAVLFEAGLIVILVPLIVWWLDIDLWKSFIMNLGLMAFFLAYAFFFNLGFDRIFGMPVSASGRQVT